jgi:hypothetical protein
MGGVRVLRQWQGDSLSFRVRQFVGADGSTQMSSQIVRIAAYFFKETGANIPHRN